jgi:hypothetical protein
MNSQTGVPYEVSLWEKVSFQCLGLLRVPAGMALGVASKRRALAEKRVLYVLTPAVRKQGDHGTMMFDQCEPPYQFLYSRLKM